MIEKDFQYYKFCAYGFLKNLRLFDPFILLYLKSVGLSFFEIGILYSAREISTVLLEVPTGIFADIIGRRKSMIFSFISYIFSFLVFALFPGFILFLIAMIFYSIGDAFRTGTHKAMIFDYLKHKNISHLKTEYYGHTRSWSQKGSAVSSLLAGVLIIYAGNYEIIFLASVVPYIFNLFNLISYPAWLDGFDNNAEKRQRINIKEFIYLLKSNSFRLRVSNSAVFDGLFKAVKDYLQPILFSLALALPLLLNEAAETRSTIIISIIYFFIFLLNSYAAKKSSLAIRLSKHISDAINYSFILGVLVFLLSGLLFELKIEIISVILFLILYMIQNMRRPMNISFISETIPENMLATGLSIESQMRTLAAAVLAPVVGFLADKLSVGLAISITSGIILLLYPMLKVKTKKNGATAPA